MTTKIGMQAPVYDKLEQMRLALTNVPGSYLGMLSAHLLSRGCRRLTALTLALEVNRDLRVPLTVRSVMSIVNETYAPTR